MQQYWPKLLVFVLATIVVLGMSTAASAQAIHRMSAEFQWTPGVAPLPEITTTILPTPFPAVAAGGKIVYTKTLFIPHKNVYVTFSGTGDTHAGPGGLGAALLMTCLIDGAPCQPGSGLATAGPPGWITLQKMPQPVAITNCSDGGGGSGDCHDNNLYATWCFGVDPGAHTIDLKLASSNGGVVFYERGHVYIDAASGPPGRCVPAALVPGSTTLP